MAKPDDLQYPVLCFAHDHSVSVARSSADLCGCNAVAWFRNRYFQDLRLYDAGATPYRVMTARLAMPLDGWRRLLARVRNRRLIVALELECLGQPSLAEAKSTTIQWLHRAPDFWEAAHDLSHWEELVSQAPSIGALCEAFA